MNCEIKIVETDDEINESTRIIRESFMTVADKFRFTKDNAATNPAFLETEDLCKMKEKGIKMFGFYENNVQVGFVAIEKARTDIFYMEKLAVLPRARHKGYGQRLLDFVMQYVEENYGNVVSIGIINDNTILKDWYKNYGFVETELKKFKHLPFDVCMMKKNV